MNIKHYILTFVSLFALAFSVLSAHAQLLYTSVAQSPYTFYYRISNDEAAAFFADPQPQKVYPLLHTKIDSVLTALNLAPSLSKGHYVRVKTVTNHVYADVLTVQDFFPYIFNNGNDLMVRVLDTLGQNIDGAEVFVGKTRLKYDKKLQLYTSPKVKGDMLMVRYSGLDAYYALTNSLARKKQVELKQSQRNGYFFAVCNKPQFRPNDTVKYKLYLLNDKMRLVRDSLNLFLVQNSRHLVARAVKPYAPGLYEGQFVLDDSLELRLGQPVSIEAVKASDPKVRTSYDNLFLFSDYELKSSRLSLRMDSPVQIAGDSLIAYASALDENDLPLAGASLVVNASLPRISVGCLRQVYYPSSGLFADTLKTSSDGTARIAIPSSVMPEANFRYDLSVTLVTADGERRQETRSVSYVYRDEQIRRSISSGKVLFEYLVSNKPSSGFADILAYDCNGKLIQHESGSMPFSLPLDPYVNTYKVTVGSKTEFIRMDNTSDSLNVDAIRKPNSLVFTSSNPRRIKFNYFVYCGQTLVKKGTGTEFRFSSREKLNQDYFVSVQYMWGGRVKTREFASYYEADDALRLSVKQKPMVFPGETSTVEVTATRAGQPVPGVDITAYAPTARFSPQLPDDFFAFGTPSYSERRKAFDYKLSQVVLPNSLSFNMERLDTTFFGRLDTIERYKFLYPDTPFYKARIPASVSQIAPFVHSKGEQVPVHVVYIDNKPTFISFVTYDNNFSSMVVPGRHQVWVRTADYLFDLGIVDVRAGEKLVISVDADKYENKVACMRALSDSEREQLLSALMPVDGDASSRFIVQNDVVLNAGVGLPDNNIAGLVSRGNVSLLYGNSSREFEFIPDNKYNFTDTSRVAITPFTLSAHQEYTAFPQNVPAQSVTDSVYTVSHLRRAIADSKIRLRDVTRSSFDYACLVGKANLRDSLSFVDFSGMRYRRYVKNKDGKAVSDWTSSPLNYLALSPDSVVLGVYNSHDVWLAPGDYVIYALFDDDSYSAFPVSVRKGLSTYVTDSVSVHAKSSRSDVYGEFLDMLAQTVRVNNQSMYLSELRALNQPLSQTALQVYDLSKDKSVVAVSDNKFGCFVKDSKGLPVSDATVVVTTDQSTRLDTKTDFSGFFSFTVPSSVRKLAAVITARDFRPYELSISLVSKSSRLAENSVTLTPAYSGFTEYSRPYFLVSGAEPVWNDYSDVTPFEYSPEPLVARLSSSGSDSRMVSSSGASVSPLYVVDGVVMDDISDIPASSIKKMERLRRVPSIYGARGKANGVIVVTTDRKKSGDPQINESFVSVESSSSSIRSNFSDYAFWQPALVTDAEGKASFPVTFPDDVTRWKTFFLGLESNRFSAMAEGDVLAYKPLMAQLSAPRFLVQGDSASVIGSVRSSSSAAESVSASFSVDSVAVSSRSLSLRPGVGFVDSVRLVAPFAADSVTASFRVDRASDSYFDGERKTIPVFPLGMLKNDGEFAVLPSGDASLSLALPKGKSDLILTSGEMSVVKDELEHLSKCENLCNEQLASRLFAYLLQDRLCRKSGENFRFAKDVRCLIKSIFANQNSEGGWGWWNVSRTELWITSHVVDALLYAKDLGYNVNLGNVSLKQLGQRASLEMTYDYEPSRLLSLAWLSCRLDNVSDYSRVVAAIDAKVARRDASGKPVYQFSTQDMFLLVRLKQLCRLPYSMSAVTPFMAKTSLGNVYFTSYSTEASMSSLPFRNDLELTVLGYDILVHADNSNADKVRNYFYESRGNDGWGNAYVSSRVLSHLVESLGYDDDKAVIEISGDYKARVDSFPYRVSLSGRSITLTKKGKAPVFASLSHSSWLSNPVADASCAAISVSLPELRVGKRADMVVDVNMKSSAEFVRVEIPVPAGCSYDEAKGRDLMLSDEVYREFRKDRVVIYCRSLSQGVHRFSVPLIPRFTGSYNLNPVHLDLMYFPSVSSNTGVKKVVVK